MQNYPLLKLIIVDIITVIAVVLPALIAIANGIKCILRSHMLGTYNRCKKTKQITQYALENFIALYKAYKVLRGNSFIDKIYKEIMTWEIVDD